MTTLDPHVIRAGGVCTCGSARRVRYAIPPCPGIPNGEISCRTDGETLWADVRHHPLPGRASIDIHLPSIDPPRYLTDADRQAIALARYSASAASIARTEP